MFASALQIMVPGYMAQNKSDNQSVGQLDASASDAASMSVKNSQEQQDQQKQKTEDEKQAKPSVKDNAAKDASIKTGTAEAKPDTHNTTPHGQGVQPGQDKARQENVQPEVRRRTAGPARQRIAANDDTPSIGGLIYALQQRPSNQPFIIAGGLTAFWLTLTIFLSWTMLTPDFANSSSFWNFLARPTVLATAGTIFIPIVLFWFLALLTWRTQELRLMSSAMTEVAVRLAEPDRMSEQAVASLGQSVRRQVAAMNNGISLALGRAGELETLVHNEVSALEHSYSSNELKIRSLIDELASEREAINNNSDRVSDAIRGVGTDVTQQIEAASVTASNKLKNVGQAINRDLQINSDRAAALISDNGNTLLQSLNTVSQRISTEVPQVIHQLGQEQVRLTKLIEEAGKNLVGLQTSLSDRTGRLEGSLGRQTQYLEKVLKDYTETVDTTIASRAQTLDARLVEHTQAIDNTLSSRTQAFDAKIVEHRQALGHQVQKLDTNLAEHRQAIDNSLTQRSQELDANLVQRTQAIDAAFTQRIKTIDHAITSSTNQIDQSFSAKARLLQQAMSNHGTALNEALTRQSADLDSTLLQGVNAIQKTSERITSQSIKTIEGLASQAEFLEDVSTGVLHKINALTDRFEHQSESIRKAGHQVETSNRQVDTVLEARHSALNNLLENMSTKTDNLDRVVENYSTRLETSLGNAEERARNITDQIAAGTERSAAAVRAELENLRENTDIKAEETLLNLRNKFGQVSEEVNAQLANITNQVNETTNDMHARTSQAARDLDVTRSQLQERLAALSNDVTHTTQHLQAHTDQAAQNVQRTQDDLNQRVSNMSDQLGNTTHGIQEQIRQSAIGIQRTQDELSQRMTLMSDELGDTTRSIRERTEAAANEIQAMRAKVYEQIDKLPETTRESAQGMRAALQDQLKALDSLSAFAHSQAVARDISLPDRNPSIQARGARHNGPQARRTPPLVQPAAQPVPQPVAVPLGQNTQLQNISQNLSDQISERQGDHSLSDARQTETGGSLWSLGDLLARASDDDHLDHEGGTHAGHGAMSGNTSHGKQGSGPDGINFEHIAGAIDVVTAHQVWSRFRAGERGVLARHMYSGQGQVTFDEIIRRYGNEPNFKASVDRYLVDFENLLREARNRDPNGKLVEKYLISETGRVYLLLAHASGRIA